MRTDVVEWLRGMSEMIDVRACRVEIGDESWEGAEYVQRLTPPPGSRSTEAYDNRAIYLVGRLPKGYTGNKSRCYNVDGVDWYVSGYWSGSDDDAFDKYHPFGRNFMLRPWDTSDGQKIDHYEMRPYRRIPMTISYE
jgi:hypothetical protein